jgi:hypothetical protein
MPTHPGGAEMADATFAPVSGGEPELEIARDVARRSVWALPVLLVVAFLIWRWPGVASTSYAVALVVGNFLLAATMTSRAARVSVALLGGVAMFGFFFRLAVIFAAFWLARDASWMSVVPFGLTVVASHLGLLFWEMTYISASLAFPGLKPAAPKES